MSTVSFKQITKRFGAVVALENVSLDVNSGELLALVGPSGCGKTTLLRLIAGLEDPDAGDMLFDGGSVLAVPPEKRRVGLVFQNYALFPHMDVWRNVAYGLKFAGAGAASSARVLELLQLVGLEGLERRMPAELSAGQQQRMALARALAPQPKILLLDEPLSALDAQLRERLRLEIRRIQRALNVTTLYVTHDQAEAMAIADRLAVMKTACIEQVGTPWEVYEAPRTEFVARFIGRGNLWEARVVAVQANSVTLDLGGWLVRARASGVPQGASVKALVRPERVRLQQPTENKLQGQIAEIEFVGDSCWVYLRESSESAWLAKADSSNSLRESQIVEFGFNADDVYLLPQS